MLKQGRFFGFAHIYHLDYIICTFFLFKIYNLNCVFLLKIYNMSESKIENAEGAQDA